MFTRKLTSLLAAAAVAAALGACSQPASSSTPTAGSEGSATITSSTKLTVVTHDSFALPDELKAKFAKESGLDVTYVAPGDGGALVNQLILTKDAPMGDVVFGIDNSFSGRAVDEGIITDYDSPALPATSKQFDTPDLTPIDFGDVCLNADSQWFAKEGIAVPTTLEDLVKPEYKDLLVVTNPASSSPGLSFLLATISAKGDDGYLDYWGQLVDNGVKVVQGWSDAYYTEFSGADGKGPRPLVVSYATSPAYTVTEDGSESTTVALLGTCFRQVEYAGVIAGAQNQKGAQEFIDFLLSEDVQSSIPETMYMYPVTDVALPAQWEKFAPLSEQSLTIEPDEISAGRDRWTKDWTAKVIG
ncbi:thiamine ABC transporter substrate-binding protein [Tessaracoccus antarcticus]|uniref:Thiamine ABC transporter substrate-binding protein n=1 Tax=Tessaracoccus antarcticus TaxID=2479848 RepID=A0A3M0G7Y9_9ACTN|nr:thiamine ABC transporter substrate-binding protein [Tessaracoccus antarcticus]RMB61150.1 thiamine ABC transporter substrate-binding protein [Tessaracoccus antarcticus]